jgi:hypothetical protein
MKVGSDAGSNQMLAPQSMYENKAKAERLCIQPSWPNGKVPLACGAGVRNQITCPHSRQQLCVSTFKKHKHGFQHVSGKQTRAMQRFNHPP